jgi:hypothetical protein
MQYNPMQQQRQQELILILGFFILTCASLALFAYGVYTGHDKLAAVGGCLALIFGGFSAFITALSNI